MLARSPHPDVQYCKRQNWVWTPRNKRDVALYPDRLAEKKAKKKKREVRRNYAAYM